MIGIVIFKVKTDQLEKEFAVTVQCPANSTDLKQQAWEDYSLEKEDRIGLMHCYCLDYTKKYNKKVIDVSFEEFADPVLEDYNYKLCQDWFKNYVVQNGMVIGSSLVVTIINIFTCTVFEYIVAIEKKHSVNDETIG